MGDPVRIIGPVRPTDRPSELYCRVCAEYKVISFGDLDTNRPSRPPHNLSPVWCHKCDTQGSLVWVEKRAKRWTPVCGDPTCQGTCSNLACVPPPKEVPPRSNNRVFIIAAGLCIAAGVFIRLAFF